MQKKTTTPTQYEFVCAKSPKAIESLKRMKYTQVTDFSNPQRHQYGIDANGVLWYTNPVSRFNQKSA